MKADFTEFYKVSDRKQMEQEAMQYLVTDTLQKKLAGPNKSKQFTAMNMEQYAPDVFVPSMFYTFMYNSPDNITANNIQFKDRVPLIFCVTHENGYITGINFNLIPCDIRSVLLDIIVSSNPSFYEKDIIDAIANHKFAVNTSLAKILIDPLAKAEFFKYLDSTTGLKISNCYRVYKEDFVLNPRLVEYDTWKYIPFLTFKDAVRGVSLSKLQIDLVNDSVANKY